MSEKVLSLADHSTQLLSGGELSVENTNIVKTNTNHVNISKIADQTSFDSAALNTFMRYPTVLYEGTISPNTDVGGTLYASEVSPILFKSTKLTRVANIATNFMQWTGSFLMRIIFTKAIFMQTKVIVAFLPGAKIEDEKTISISDMYGAQFHAVMNPDNDNELSFTIPFISGKVWHTMKESTGLIIVKLFQPLIASQSAANSNNTIPFTITLSSDHNRDGHVTATPITFRYLIAPTYANPIINEIIVNDLTTQISPQIPNTVNSYSQYSTMANYMIRPEKRYKSIVFLPVTVPTTQNGTATIEEIDRAIYGDNSGIYNTFTSNCKLTDSNNNYCSFSASKFVALPPKTERYTIDFARLNVKLTNDPGIRYVTVSAAPTFEDVLAYAGSGTRVWLTNYLVGGVDTLTMAVKCPQKWFEIPTTYRIQQFLIVATLSNGQLKISNVENATFKAGFDPRGNTVLWISGAMSGTSSVSGNMKFVDNAFPVVPFTTDAVAGFTDAYFSSVNYKSQEVMDVAQNFIVGYSTCTAIETDLQVRNKNYANIDLDDNNMFSSALDARLLNEIPPETRINISAIYMTIRKGIKVVATATKYISGLLTFIDGFLPPGSPDVVRAGNDYLIIPLDGIDPISFGPSTREALTKYQDDTIIHGRLTP